MPFPGPRAPFALAAAALLWAQSACSTSTGTSTPSPTQAPATLPSPSVAPSGAALPSLAGSDAELEGLIPDAIGSLTLQKSSMRGTQFLSSADSSPQTTAFLRALGVSPADVGVAFGIGVDPATSTGVVMFVFRAAGADPETLLRTFKAANDQGATTPYRWTALTVAGKRVEVTTDPSQGGVRLYLYARDDTLFLVGATSDEQVAEALGTLP